MVSRLKTKKKANVARLDSLVQMVQPIDAVNRNVITSLHVHEAWSPTYTQTHSFLGVADSA